MKLEEGDVVLCTVDRIVGTNVFVKIDNSKDSLEGCIVLSEIAPGRIRNIRDYVTPKKKIACKVLRISGDRIDLSLRRVSLKEQKEVKEVYNQEKGYESVLKGVLGKESGSVIEKILRDTTIYDFLTRAKNNPKELEAVAGTANAKKILDIIKSQQKKKKAVVKKEISLTTTNPEGVETIKKLLERIKNVEIKYVAAGKYMLKAESEDVKKADHELRDIILEIEKNAKKSGIDFSIFKK